MSLLILVGVAILCFGVMCFLASKLDQPYRDDSDAR